MPLCIAGYALYSTTDLLEMDSECILGINFSFCLKQKQTKPKYPQVLLKMCNIRKEENNIYKKTFIIPKLRKYKCQYLAISSSVSYTFLYIIWYILGLHAPRMCIFTHIHVYGVKC